MSRLPGAALPADVPIDLTGEQARRLAELELADPAYRSAEPSWVQRAIAWVVEQIQDLVGLAGELAPGGWLGILGLVALLVIGGLLVRWRLGPAAASAALEFRVDPGTSAAQYRQRADALAGAGKWADAVSERMRALVRSGQERGLIDVEPGWTADEVAHALGAAVPAARPPLTAAARTFDDVRYGGRTATAASYEAIRVADDAVRTARVVVR